MKFHSEYARLRREAGLTQADIRDLLTQYGISMTIPQLSRLENGKSTPNLALFFALCEILKVEMPLEHFSDFHAEKLNAVGLAKVETYISDLVATGLYSPAVKAQRRLPLYILPASAGTGQLLDSEDYEMIDVPNGVPACADFAVRVSGDSMEPRFHNGDYVWVQKQNTLNSGDIGVFFLNGESYVKKFGVGRDGMKLVSLNTKYPPIEVAGGAEFRIFGRVVGRSSD